MANAGNSGPVNASATPNVNLRAGPSHERWRIRNASVSERSTRVQLRLDRVGWKSADERE